MRWELAIPAERCVYLMRDYEDDGVKQCDNIGPWHRPGIDEEPMHVCRMHKESIDRAERFLALADTGEDA